ncbi:MAG: sulfur carrier protein ThiS adenylyltransferase ThiF [Porphyromonadaceae bacterium]|nr:MAG: sulfur carrier protein ThiS adenylyltransferase ThiF [Porphyromonadaceae bacterium]
MNWLLIQEKLKNRSAGIAGAGGLGSNCAAALVRVGIGRLVISDFDRVEESNLNRQFYFRDQIGQPKVEALKTNLLRINPLLILEIHQVILDSENIPELFSGVDVLFEAFDRAEQKAMIIESALTTWPERPLIIGSGMAGFGDSNSIRMRSCGNLYICGDESAEIGPEMPPLAPRVGIVANMMANVGIDLLLNS